MTRMSKGSIKTTSQDFDLFRRYCAEYAKAWCLEQWDITYKHTDLSEQGFNASCSLNLEGYQATICLSTVWDARMPTKTPHRLRESAKHEMLHVLLGRLAELGQYRFVQAREFEAANHEIVNKLINLLPDLK